MLTVADYKVIRRKFFLDGQPHAFLLQPAIAPVPEPSSVILRVTGGVLVGFASLRRRWRKHSNRWR